MIIPQDPITADREFFDCLMRADIQRLGKLLADDFLLIAVGNGQEVSRAMLLEALQAGELRFLAVNADEVQVRQYGGCAVVTGRTEMQVAMGGRQNTVHSRYAHIFVNEGERWRMVSAQGTPILDA
jgi:ketosteroid isomerase-like protein